MKLLLLNPKRKLTVKKGAAMRKRKTAKRSTTHKAKRRNPRAVATVAASAPRRKSIRRRARTRVAAARRSIKRRVSGFGGSARGLVPAAKQTLIQGGIAGIGAVGADIVAAQLMKYIPASLKTTQMQPLVQVGVSLLSGLVIGKVNKKIGDAIAVGGVTVATYNLTKSLLKTSGIPGLSAYNPLAGYDYDPSYGMGDASYLRSVQNNNPLAEYVTQMDGMFDNQTFGDDSLGMYDNSNTY